MAQKTAVHVKKFKSGNLSGLIKHLTREKEIDTNPDYDESRRNENITILSSADAANRINDRIKGLGLKRLRKDAVKLVGAVVTAPKGFDKDKAEDYLIEATRFFAAKYGISNLMYAEIHNDEKTPHLHLGIVPVTEDGRLSAKDLFNKQTLTQLQTEFARQVGKKYGLERGTSIKDSKKKYVEMARLKCMTAEKAAKAAEKAHEAAIKALDKVREQLADLDTSSAAIEQINSDPPKRKSALLGDDYYEMSVKTGEALKQVVNDYRPVRAAYVREASERIDEGHRAYVAEEKAAEATQKLAQLQKDCQPWLTCRQSVRNNFKSLAAYVDKCDREHIADCCIKNSGRGIYEHLGHVVSMYRNAGFRDFTPEQAEKELNAAEERASSGAPPRPNFGGFDESKQPWDMLSKMTQDAKRLSIANLDR